MTFSLQYLIALIATILLELVVYLTLKRQNFFKALLYSLLINCFTFPLANYVYQNSSVNLYVIEFVVLIVETPLIRLLSEVKYQRALLISFVANLVSALAGLVLLKFIILPL